MCGSRSAPLRWLYSQQVDTARCTMVRNPVRKKNSFITGRIRRRYVGGCPRGDKPSAGLLQRNGKLPLPVTPLRIAHASLKPGFQPTRGWSWVAQVGRAESRNFPTDSCNLPTEDIMDAQNFVCPKYPQNGGFSAPNSVFLDENFATRRIFSDKTKI